MGTSDTVLNRVIRVFSGMTLDSIYILDRLKPVFWRGLYYPKLDPNQAQIERGYPGNLPVQWSKQEPGFPRGMWLGLIGFEEIEINDPNDPPIRKEVVDVWGAIDGSGTSRKTYDRAKTWTEPVERVAPWDVPWGTTIAVGSQRVVVPGVYNKDYPLSDDTNWGPNVIAGYCPGTSNPLFTVPIQTFADVVSTVYLGDDEVIYADYFRVGMDTPMHWVFTDHTSHLPGTTDGGIDPGNGNLYEFNIQDPPPTGHPSSFKASSMTRGYNYTYMGLSPTYNTEGGIHSRYENTRIFSVNGTTGCKRSTYNQEYLIQDYADGVEVPDVPQFSWKSNFQVTTIAEGYMDSFARIAEVTQNIIEQAAAQYVIDGGYQHSGGALIPGSGTLANAYPTHQGPQASALVNITVWGKIEGGKVVPIKTKVCGWQTSSASMGAHTAVGVSNSPPSTSDDGHGRRCTIVYPKYYLGNDTILGIVRMGRIAPSEDTKVTISQGLSPFGYQNGGSHAEGTWGDYPPYVAPPLPSVPYSSNYLVTVPISGIDSSSNSQGRYWTEWAVSEDRGENWGPSLTRNGVIISDDIGYVSIKVIGNGKAIAVLDQKLYEINTTNAKDGNAEITNIPLVEAAGWVHPTTEEFTPYPVTEMISCMRSPDQFMFEVLGNEGYSLILSYDKGEHMVLVDKQEPDEAGLFTTPRPYFVPTFAGKGLDSQPDDKDYPYLYANTPQLQIVTTELLSGSVGYSYSDMVGVTGGVPPYTFTVSAGNLPNGLSISPDYGMITGTAVLKGVYNFTIRIKDSTVLTPQEILAGSQKNIVDGSFEIEIIQNVPLPLDIEVIGSGIPPAKTNYAYSVSFRGIGGKPPYKWSGSNLSTWMTVGASTGILSGIPLVPGVYAPNIKLTDSNTPPASITKAYVVTVKNEG